MKDQGLSSGNVINLDTSDPRYKGFYGFRKMFWKYLNKLNVQFSDPCCTLADNGGARYTTTRFDTVTGLPQYYDSGSKTWINQASWVSTSTTTTIKP